VNNTLHAFSAGYTTNTKSREGADLHHQSLVARRGDTVIDNKALSTLNLRDDASASVHI
jgi:hypothetical protein